MSELWRELIERQSPELAGALALRRVSISKKTGEMCVHLCADRLFAREEYKRVQQALSAAFPAVGVRLKLTYPSLRERAEADVCAITPLLIELVRHESPGSVPFLLNGETDFSPARRRFHHPRHRRGRRGLHARPRRGQALFRAAQGPLFH